MYQLVYVSAATHEFKGAELADLLRVARENNGRDGVTGMLLYHGGSFFQVLEGGRDKVHEIFRRVEKDPRHQKVTVLHEEELVEERDFPDWSMAWCEISDAALREVDGFNDLMVNRRPAQAFPAPSTVQQMVLTFREYAA